jgi:hypothetical protein
MAFAVPIIAAIAGRSTSSRSESGSDPIQAITSPWYEGDIVLATNGSSATGGSHSYPSIGTETPYTATDLGHSPLFNLPPPAPGTGPSGGGGGGGTGGVSPLLLVAGAAVVGVMLWMRHK